MRWNMRPILLVIVPAMLGKWRQMFGVAGSFGGG